MVIKPSGVSYEDLSPDKRVIVDLDGKGDQSFVHTRRNLPQSWALCLGWESFGSWVSCRGLGRSRAHGFAYSTGRPKRTVRPAACDRQTLSTKARPECLLRAKINSLRLSHKKKLLTFLAVWNPPCTHIFTMQGGDFCEPTN